MKKIFILLLLIAAAATVFAGGDNLNSPENKGTEFVIRIPS